MTCAEVNELLTEYIMGELPLTTQQAVKDHLENCTACQQQCQWIMRVNGKFIQWQASIETPPTLGQRWEQALRQQMAADAPKSRTGWFRKKVVMFSAVAVLVVAVAWGMEDNYQQFFDTQLAENATTGMVKELPEVQEHDPEQAPELFLGSDVATLPQQEASSKAKESPKQISRINNDSEQQNAGSAVSRSTPKVASPVDVTTPMEQRDEQQQPRLAEPKLDFSMILNAECYTTIDPELVQQLKILVGEESLDVTDQSQQALLVQGINEACPTEKVPMGANFSASHTINVTLNNGEIHAFHYSEQTNIGYSETLFGDQPVIPGPTLLQVLREDEDMLTN